MSERFDAVEQRVLGALAEKEATVPDTYPMTLNGLVSACNQRNNREPVMDLEPHEVQRTLDALKARGLVRFVHPSHGARSTKYRHALDERLGLDPGELALVAVLLLRGPQTLGELRARTERAHPFPSLDTVAEALESMAARDDPLVVHLDRRPGQKESRWSHRLGDRPEPGADDDDPVTPAAPVAMAVAEAAPASDLAARVAALEARLAAVESALADLGVSPSDEV